jgi:hypothetical protein
MRQCVMDASLHPCAVDVQSTGSRGIGDALGLGLLARFEQGLVCLEK